MYLNLLSETSIVLNPQDDEKLSIKVRKFDQFCIPLSIFIVNKINLHFLTNSGSPQERDNSTDNLSFLSGYIATQQYGWSLSAQNVRLK